MKAILCHKYGGQGTLRRQLVNRAVLLKDKVLVKVIAASIDACDGRLMPGSFWLPKDRILGADLAWGVRTKNHHLNHIMM